MDFLSDPRIFPTSSSSYTPAGVAYLAKTSWGGLSPDDRLAALQTLLKVIPAEPMVDLLLDRLAHEGDTHLLWPCATWLVEMYGEVAAACKALVTRVECDPNPAIRKSVLQLLSVRFGASRLVVDAVARVAANDVDDDVRAVAAEVLDELARIKALTVGGDTQQLLESAARVLGQVTGR